MLQLGGIQFETMASAVLYIPEVMEHVNQEVPDYGFMISAIILLFTIIPRVGTIHGRCWWLGGTCSWSQFSNDPKHDRLASEQYMSILWSSTRFLQESKENVKTTSHTTEK